MDELDYFVENAFSLVTSGYYHIGDKRKRGLHSLSASLREGSGVIAEFKRRTPSSDARHDEAGAFETARKFVDMGACAISILTEPHRFNGSVEDIIAAAELPVPLLMKDFIIDGEQIEAAERAGADAVLLIAEIFDRYQYSLELLEQEAHSRGIEVILEVNSVQQFVRAQKTGADIIGINCRDLGTLTLHRGRVESILSQVRKDRPVLGMSGIESPEDVRRMLLAGADGVLVGTSIMRRPELLAGLVEAARIAKGQNMR
jgi:indole-3-glycerol phosphate synthase